MEWFLSALGGALISAGYAFLQFLPYMLAGVVMGEILRLASWTKLLYKWMNRRRFLSMLLAVPLGILSPLCTYGTIPVMITLYRGGVSLPPLLAFMVASSLMNPQLFLITGGGLGFGFAFMRVAVTFAFGLTAGCLMLFIPERFAVRNSFRLSEKSEAEIAERVKKRFVPGVFAKDCLKNLLFTGKYMALGVIVGTIIEAFIPKGYVMYLFGGSTAGAILTAAVAGIPLYACGGGAIPMVRSLMAGGMGPGAAMAFMTVGQATRISPLMAMASFFQARFIVCYCIFLIVFSVLTGLLM